MQKLRKIFIQCFINISFKSFYVGVHSIHITSEQYGFYTYKVLKFCMQIQWYNEMVMIKHLLCIYLLL